MPLGGIGKAVGSFTSSAPVSAALDYFSAKSLQDDAQSFSKEMYKQRYLYTVRDMKSAGINPVLAAGMGLGGGPSPNSPVTSTAPGTAASAASLRKAQIETEKEKAWAARTQGELNKQNTQQAEALTDLYATQTLLHALDVPEKNRVANLFNSDYGSALALSQQLGRGGTIGQIGGTLYGLGRMWNSAKTAIQATKTFKDTKRNFRNFRRKWR